MSRETKVCATPQCPNLTTGTYCPGCQQAHTRKHNLRTNARYSNPEHRDFKRKVLERDGHRCRYCGSTENVQAAHLKPLWDGGTYDPDNGVAACDFHNKELDRRYREEHSR